MKRITLLIFGLFASLFTWAQTQEQEMEAVKVVCHYYIDGGTNGDSIMFSKAFHPDGLMQYMRNDTVQQMSLKNFMARMPNSGKKQNRTGRVESVQVYGNVAVAKITIEYPDFYFHDIMTLLKTKDGWKIAGKIFNRENK